MSVTFTCSDAERRLKLQGVRLNASAPYFHMQ